MNNLPGIKAPRAISEKMLINARKLPPEKLGAWFEARSQELFKHLKEYKRLTFLRLYDSKSAGAYLPKQPGDFIVASPNDVFLVECKASKTHKSLVSCAASNVSKEQAAEHWMWSRSGHTGMFLFISVVTGEIEVWDGKYIGDSRRCGRRISKNSPGFITSIQADQYLSLLEALFFEALGRYGENK